MKINYIPRNELVDVLRANLQQAAYSTGIAERHIRNARRIHAFMEEKKIEVYTPDVGEQFCDINDGVPLFKWIQAERRTVTHLLNRIILGLPFNQTPYQPKIFKIRGDFYEEGEAFLEKIKNENRLTDHERLSKPLDNRAGGRETAEGVQKSIGRGWKIGCVYSFPKYEICYLSWGEIKKIVYSYPLTFIDN